MRLLLILFSISVFFHSFFFNGQFGYGGMDNLAMSVVIVTIAVANLTRVIKCPPWAFELEIDCKRPFMTSSLLARFVCICELSDNLSSVCGELLGEVGKSCC